MDSDQKQPSQQGQLDNLCGIYSLVNAIAYLYDKRVKRKRLKLKLISVFHSQWDLEELLYEGMDDTRLDYLIDQVLMTGYYAKHFPVQVTKPFVKRRYLTNRALMDEMQAFLDEGGYQGTRIILLGTVEHWSLAKRIDEKFLYLFDSAGYKRARRSSYSLKANARRFQLFPSCIYFFTRLEEV